MNLVEFLQDLSLKGLKLRIEDGRLLSGGSQEVLTRDVITQLKQHKTEILQLLRERPDILNVYPLSYGQQGIWFLWQLAPESHAYNLSFAARIYSVVDITAMEKALGVLRSRHPILRTTFPQRGAEPIQQVHQNQELDFLLLDASTWSEEELKAKVVETHQLPFDLEGGPVMRVRWFTRSNQEHVLLLTIHHIACDGWSIDLLIQELPKLYQAQRAGVEPSLPPLKHSYQDYVARQRDILQGTEGERLWNYWQQKLAGELPVLNLPTDRPLGPIQTYNSAFHHFKLPEKLTKELRELAQSSGVTLYMMLLAAFQVLLYRYTGQEDILVGSPTSGRSQPELAPLVGFFVETVVMRTNLSNNPSFKEFLPQVRQTVLEALTHQDYPFVLLVEKLQPHRVLSHTIIFQASFALQQLQKSQDIQELLVDEREKDVDWGGLKLRPFEIDQQGGQFDLDLEMMEGSSSVSGIFKYNPDLFDGSTIERMASHFQNLLSAIVENPQLSVGELPLLSEAERHQLLREWNDTAREYPLDKCIHQLFEEQVEKTPDAVAVVFEKEQLTYQQLNQRANQLAHHLLSLGVGPEVLVGICVERSVEMVVGLLGILKAGGAYLALDPNYPKKRLNFMLSDARGSVLLTQEKLAENFPVEDLPVFFLDRDWEVISQESKTNLVSAATSENLAYVVYTSGSTGTSKGVAITHESLVNAYRSWEKVYQLRSLTSHLQMASFSFDVFSGDTIRALCSGGKLVLCSREWLLEPEKLYKLMLQEKTDIGEFVPSVLRNLVQYLETTKQDLHFMRLLIVGSDSLYVKEYEEFKHFCGSNTRLINSYGVSEATIDSTYFESTKVNLSVDGLVPIGRPFANTQTYILDSHLQPVPIGVIGELHIGGIGLARGYLNHPDLTEQKFIPNPFKFERTSLLYKTGDLARYLSDGNIEFLGRIDNQVKVRGFRIEPGEIEAVLNTHPQIQQAVVIATGELPGNKRLVAYLVTDQPLSNHQIREFLFSKLPEYMVPSAFVILDALPLTPNGKVDRKALPATEGEITREQEYVAPRTPSEEIIANIFTNVLGVPNIGIYDNLFELGGHSLLATQIISRLNQTFSVEISLRSMFETPTVAGLAEAVTDLQLQQTEDEEITHLLAELEGLSDKEVQQLLAQEMHCSVHD